MVVAVAVAKIWRTRWLETGRGLKVKVFQEEHTYLLPFKRRVQGRVSAQQRGDRRMATIEA